MDLRQRQPFLFLVIGVLLFAIVAYRPEVMLFVLFLGYAVLGAIFGILGWGRQPKIFRPPPPLENGDDLHESIDEDSETL